MKGDGGDGNDGGGRRGEGRDRCQDVVWLLEGVRRGKKRRWVWLQAGWLGGRARVE